MPVSPKASSRAQDAVSVFEFLDYRAYLRAYYLAAKKRRGGFSFRTFSKRAGLKSPNFFKLVMDGERNLGAETVTKFADALSLDGTEREFFSHLVTFAQAKDDAEKNRVFERIATSRRFRSAKRIDGMLHQYLSHWHNTAIRELVLRADFQPDPVFIAAQLRPEITAKQAAESLALLLELGLLKKKADGIGLEQAEPTLTTEHEVAMLSAANFHRQMMQLAAESIERVPAVERDLAALTACIPASLVPEIKRRIHEFRESLTELCDSATSNEVVYQLNVQWFPLSHSASRIR